MSKPLTTMDIATAIRDALAIQDQVERSDCEMLSIDTILDGSNVKIVADTGEAFTVVVISNKNT